MSRSSHANPAAPRTGGSGILAESVNRGSPSGEDFLLVNKGACVVIFFLETSQGRRAHNLMKHAAIRVRAIDSANIQSGVSELY